MGRAAGLNDDQIIELAKLERGVAAVYQNEWLEPVLCKVDKFEKKSGTLYSYQGSGELTDHKMEVFFQRMLYGMNDSRELTKEDVERLNAWIDRQDIGDPVKDQMRQVAKTGDQLSEDARGEVLYCVLRGKSLLTPYLSMDHPAMIQKAVDLEIMDRLHVSEDLAGQIRKSVYLYAASHQEDQATRETLLRHGGVQ